MAFEVEVKQIVDERSGSLDLSRLFALSQASRQHQSSPKPQPAPTRTDTGPLLWPSGPRRSPLVLQGRNPVTQRSQLPRKIPPLFDFLFAGAKRGPAKLPNSHQVSLTLVEGNGSRATGKFDLRSRGQQKVRIPFFLDRYISAIALKQLAGRPNDVLLRKAGAEWEVVADDETIDLADRTKTFRLGPVQVYS